MGKLFLLINTILALVVVIPNCAEYSLQQKEEVFSLNLDSEFCLRPPEGTTRYSKIVFVIDKSGSNGQTDPDKTRRYNSIKNFIDAYQNEEYYKWSLITFNSGRAEPLVADGQLRPIFSNSTDAYNALDQFNNDNDNGDTPYLAALGAVDSLIVTDLQEYPEEDSTYNIFFISDGEPSPGSNDNCQSADCEKILQQVRDIVGRDPGKVFLSTVYYYVDNINPLLSNGLKVMAQEGGGSYSDAGANQDIDFKEVKTGLKPDPWVIKGSKLIAYNLNSGFCSDGSVDTDSDADGLCDKDEELYNTIFADVLADKYPGKKFDPRNRNSLDENFSDAFVWKFDLLQTSSGITGCASAEKDMDFDFLNTCEEYLLKDVGNANGPTPEWTDFMRANNGGAADPRNFDSDGDLFLDFMEFYHFKLESGISSAVDYLSIYNKYVGGVSAENIMLEHKHFKYANQDRATDYSIRTYPLGVNQKTGEQCYKFELDPVTLYDTKAVTLDQVTGHESLVNKAGENKVLVYFISTKEDDRHGRGILYYQIINLNYGDNINLEKHINLENFKTYKAPKAQ